MSAAFVGRIGSDVLIRFTRHGKTVFEVQFAPTEAEALAARILGEVRILRPPPKGLRRIK